MNEVTALKQEIEAIKERNTRVEFDKAWETSWTRRVSIAIATYIIVLLFMITIGIEKPFIAAIVPVIGFLLSTLSVERIKKWWMIKEQTA